MEIKIDEGIPCPYSVRVDGLNYPFRDMRIGDSFLIPEETNPVNVRMAAFQFSRRGNLGWRFTVRKTKQGYRCWRMNNKGFAGIGK